MNLADDCLYSISKENINLSKLKKNLNSKINIKRNLKIMNDPAFHLNKTLKEYITNKLCKNNSNEKIMVSKDIKNKKLKNNISNIFPKVFEHNNYFNRIKTKTNIVNKYNKKNLSSKKNHHSKIKNSNAKNSKSNKKIMKSKSNNKFDLNNYISNYHHNKRNRVKNKIYENQKIINTNSFNSIQKYCMYSGSTALSINDNNNQLFDKNNISVAQNNNNHYISNHSTLDVNSLKSPFIQSTSKKNKFIKHYFNNKYTSENLKDKYNYTNFKTEVMNINIDKNSNSIIKDRNINNNKNNEGFPSKNNKNKKIFNKYKNKSVMIVTTNINNKNENFSNYYNKKDLYKEKDIYRDENYKTCYTISNQKISSYYDKNISKKEDKKDNCFEYLKKIENLENENKLLKGEIRESKNRLMILENKIGELLGEKKLVEKEDCPKPMPYVKKYSIQTSIDLYHSNSPNKEKDKDIEKEKEIINSKEKNKETPSNNKEKKIIYKIKKTQTINNNKIKNENSFKKYKSNKNVKENKNQNKKNESNLASAKKRSFHLNTSKSISYLRTRNNTDINLKNNISNISNNNISKKKEKKKIFKKINELLYVDNSSIYKSHSPLRISTEGNTKK